MALSLNTSCSSSRSFYVLSRRRRSHLSHFALILSPLSFCLHPPSLICSSTVPSKPAFSNIYKEPATARAASQPKYVYPDPIPEFAEAETQKFRSELRKRLSKEKDTFGADMDAVVKICAEIFKNFLHEEYGGPGTLLVEPFTDMLLALKEKKLPGAHVAARAALLWAQNYVDQDWEIWTSQQPK